MILFVSRRQGTQLNSRMYGSTPAASIQARSHLALDLPQP